MKRYIILIALLTTFCFSISAQNLTPKNIIVMISDGCGYNHIKATNYFQYGEDSAQVYQKFPVQMAMSTYPAKVMPLIKAHGYDTKKAWKSFSYLKTGYTCSAAAATAMATGTKTYNGAIGVDEDKEEVQNLTEFAKEINKAAGVVTSVQFAHATPAGFSAHNVKRSNYSEIAMDMILHSKLDVVMGCGHPYYDNNGKKQNKAISFDYVGDSLIFNQILKEGNIKTNTSGVLFTIADIDGDKERDPWTFIEAIEDFERYTQGETPKRLFGIAQVHKTLQFARSQGEDERFPFNTEFIKTVPQLKTMVKAALNVLDNDEDGLFLMVEGGAIDWAAHANSSNRMIEEEVEFNNAVREVVSWIETNSSWDETLLIVTADHETGLLWGPKSGKGEFSPIANNGIGALPDMEWNTDNHSNSLVPFFAKGAGSDTFVKYADENDDVRGSYITNTEIAEAIKELWKK